MDLNISVKVLSNQAPYLLVWWNDKNDCLDGFLVTCPCQGYCIGEPAVDAKNTARVRELSKALELAEIVTLHPGRIARSLCTDEDARTWEEERQTNDGRMEKQRRKRGKRKKRGKDRQATDRSMDETSTYKHTNEKEHVIILNDFLGKEVHDNSGSGDLTLDGDLPPMPGSVEDRVPASGTHTNLPTERVDEDETARNCQYGKPPEKTARGVEEASDDINHAGFVHGGIDQGAQGLRNIETELPNSCSTEGVLFQTEAGAMEEQHPTQGGSDRTVVPHIPEDMVVTVQMPDDGQLASIGDIPQNITAMIKEVFSSSAYGENGVSDPLNSISLPMTLHRSNAAILPPGNIVPVIESSNNPLTLITAEDSPGGASLNRKYNLDPVPVPGIPNSLYAKDLSNPVKVDEWERLQQFNNDKFLAKCNKKRQRFVRFVLCELCGAALCSKTYQKHLETQHPHGGKRSPQFACKICGKKFMYAAHVSRHELIHQKVRFQCQFCPKSFSQSNACRIHEKTHQGESSDGRVALLEQRLNPWVKCLECGKQVRQSSMKKHMKVHDPTIPPAEPISCPHCGKTYSCKGSLVTHMKIHGERNHACQVCGKKFHQKMSLMTHMRIHTKEKPLPCRHCHERFSRHQARINHERREHTGVKPYHCHVCDKHWRDRVTYTQHMKRHHPDEPVMTLRKKVQPSL